jgi:phosphopantothenoylcysteine decarboxylase/phosphopantothenate--cysteine ligase
MRVIVTAGPTREYIDGVRFITNASSGRMGFAVAAAAVAAGHQVTLIAGNIPAAPPAGCEVVPFVSVEDLRQALEKRFDACDALVMTAAVGDFRPEEVLPGKLSRRGGPITLRLVPTEDVLASLRPRKRKGQTIVAFAVEEGTPREIEAKALAEMAAKGGDFVVVNTPAAMAAARSRACILSSAGVVLSWAERDKEELAEEIVRLIGTKNSRDQGIGTRD